MDGTEVEQCGSRWCRHRRADGAAREEQQRVPGGVEPSVAIGVEDEGRRVGREVPGQSVTTGLAGGPTPFWTDRFLDVGGKFGLVDDGNGVRLRGLARIHPG